MRKFDWSSNNQKPTNEDLGPFYDTTSGITKSLVSLEQFLEVLKQREIAGYLRNERLHEFYVFGRYYLDSCGNCMKAKEIVPKEKFPDIPEVLTRQEFFAFIEEHSDGKEHMISFSMGSDIPDSHLICPVCKAGWDIINCHDTVVTRKTENISLHEFIGKTLKIVKSNFSKLNDGIYLMHPEVTIRNDRFIDLSPEYPNPEDDWQKNQVKNKLGWVGEQQGINEGYVIQEGDFGHFDVFTYYHSKCNRINLLKEEEKYFTEIFEKAGFVNFSLIEISNEYCNCEHCAPWFNITTQFGVIKIGWRKRVINIDWSKLYDDTPELKSINSKLTNLFENEDTTKGQNYIHAWGAEKAQEYLKTIHSYLLKHKAC